MYGHLLFMSAESLNARTDCGAQGIPPPPGYVASSDCRPPAPVVPGVEPERPPASTSAAPARTGSAGCASSTSATSRGPKQVAAVQSCRGSLHAYTLRDRPERQRQRVYLYLRDRKRSSVGGTRGVLRWRPNGQPRTPPCSGSTSSRCRWRTRSRRRSYRAPRIFADAKTGALNGSRKTR